MSIKIVLSLSFFILLLNIPYSAQEGQVGVSLFETMVPEWLDAYGEEFNITLYVCYTKDSCLTNGDIIHSSATKQMPFVTIVGNDLEDNASYSFVVVDVDEYTPRYPIAKSNLHFLIMNIRGSTKPYEHIFDTGKVVVNYQRPHKPYFYKGDIGIHHYYSLLFKQDGYVEEIEAITNSERFNVRKFASTYKLGYPVTGVVFKVNYTSHN